jgi:hypothetical protein
MRDIFKGFVMMRLLALTALVIVGVLLVLLVS